VLQIGKLVEAVNVAELMLRSGQRMELNTFNVMINTAWGSGAPDLQQYALQLYDRACAQGHYKLHMEAQVRAWAWPAVAWLTLVPVYLMWAQLLSVCVACAISEDHACLLIMLPHYAS
jgi:hypothetical protein